MLTLNGASLKTAANKGYFLRHPASRSVRERLKF